MAPKNDPKSTDPSKSQPKKSEPKPGSGPSPSKEAKPGGGQHPSTISGKPSPRPEPRKGEPGKPTNR
jgi:hypothetical protein